jgi:hypothetical protein
VNSVKAGIRPSALIIGNFRKPRQTSRRPAQNPDNVYLAIALTTLDAETGILNFFPRDSSGQTLGQAEVLEPGDGILCCAEDASSGVGGEGGIVLMIRYQADTDRPRD